MRLLILVGLVSTIALTAQDAPPALVKPVVPEPQYTVSPGTRIPLTLINSVSTKHSVEGDRVYLQTVFPIMAAGRIVIPPGSYVLGTVTQLKRPGRVHGRGELFLRFDSITLPNGVVRDFRARVSTVDARGDESLDRREGKIKGDGNVGGDVRTIGEAAGAGASIGTIAGAASGRYGMGAGIGAGAGALAGLMGVLLTRGPEAILAQGSTMEMVLDRQLVFQPEELAFGNSPVAQVTGGPGPAPRKSSSNQRRFPF